MHNEDSELEVFLVPVGDDVVLAVPADDMEVLAPEARHGLASLFSKTGPLIAAALDGFIPATSGDRLTVSLALDMQSGANFKAVRTIGVPL